VQGDELVGEATAAHAVGAHGLGVVDARVPVGKLRGMATEQRRVTVRIRSAVRRGRCAMGGGRCAVRRGRRAMRRGRRRTMSGARRAAGAGGGALGSPFDDLERTAPLDRGRAERTGDGRGALLEDVVGAGGTQVDRVMTGGAMLDDRAAIAQGERIVAAADDDLALTSDVDIVVPVAGIHCALAKNGHVDLAATRNADGGAH
jgi:hypothetical protein